MKYRRRSRTAILITLTLLLFVFPGRSQGATVTLTADLSTKSARTEESRLADIVADAVRAAESSDAAFVAATYLDDVTLKKGTIPTTAVAKVLVFRDLP